MHRDDRITERRQRDAEGRRARDVERERRRDEVDRAKAERLRGRELDRGQRRRPDDLIWDRPEPGARRANLSRDAIADSAVSIADTEGIQAVSMRRIATELGVGTMTLYHYVHSKEELMALMDNRVMGEVVLPEGEQPEDWREALTVIANRTRASLRRHPWSLDLEVGAMPSPNSMRHFEQSLAAVAALQVSDQKRLELVTNVDDYVFGVSMRESRIREWTGGRAVPDASDFPDYLVEFFESRMATGEYPNLSRFVGEMEDGVRETFNRTMAVAFDETRFDRGLTRLLDGMERELTEQPGAEPVT